MVHYKPIYLTLGQWRLHRGVAEDIPLQCQYRASSQLGEVKGPLENALYNRLNTLFTLDFSLVFYDLTSTYFEGAGPAQAEKGHSRDHRHDRPQVGIGLLVNQNGIPISHIVFEGNLKDSKTLPQMLEHMKGTFKRRRCIFVSDKGMVSSGNLKELDSSGYEYIVSIKLRRSKEARALLAMLPERENSPGFDITSSYVSSLQRQPSAILPATTP